MVNILFNADNQSLTQSGIIKTLYNPACGTGGMLSIGEQHLHDFNPDAKLEVFGQEINLESYAICKSGMLIKGQNPSNVKFGNTFTIDGLRDEKKTKTGYEINFTKYFYEFKPLRSLAEIKADILALEASSLELEKKVLD